LADQKQFDAVGKTTICEIPEETMVWPEGGGRGVLQKGLFADRLGNRKVRGLPAFRARGPVLLYFDRNYWTIPQGTIFGTYARDVKKIVIKK